MSANLGRIQVFDDSMPAQAERLVIMLCTECNAKIPTLTTRKRRANEAFHTLGTELWTSIPYLRIDTILQSNGFAIPTYEHLEAVGGDTRVHTEVGEGLWLTMSWYRHESGRYEITAYVN